jgi:glycosyltransferase involved in cell wall biosynthesis
MNTPKVSIIVPCYNQAKFLDESLQSVLNQTYTNWECFIVNDGSSDNTEEVAKKWTDKDCRFIYLYKDNGGVSSSRNFALQKVRGDYIQFLDSDDFMDKRKLEWSLQLIQKEVDNNIQMVVSDFRMFVDDSNITSIPYCLLNSQILNFETLLYSWSSNFSIPIHCGFFKTSLFESIRFPEDMTAQEDWIVWVSIFKRGCKSGFIDKPLALYRKNPSSRTMTKSLLLDQLKAYEYFKGLLSEEEFHRLSLVLISRYYKSNEELKHKWRAIKESNTYQTGLMIKKFLNSIGVLKISRRLFPVILKLKAK